MLKSAASYWKHNSVFEAAFTSFDATYQYNESMPINSEVIHSYMLKFSSLRSRNRYDIISVSNSIYMYNPAHPCTLRKEAAPCCMKMFWISAWKEPSRYAA